MTNGGSILGRETAEQMLCGGDKHELLKEQKGIQRDQNPEKKGVPGDLEREEMVRETGAGHNKEVNSILSITGAIRGYYVQTMWSGRSLLKA